MARVPQTSWTALIEQIASRERELELISTNDLENEAFNPYWTREDVELLFKEISDRLIREIPQPDLEALGSLAIALRTYTNGDELTLDVVNVLGVTISTSATAGSWYPASYVSPASFFQVFHADPDANLTRWTVFDGRVWFLGTSAKLVVLVEPSIGDYQGNALALPPVAYDDARVDWVHKMLQVEDFMPGGRI